MALTGEQAVQRFIENEDRVNTFVNDATGYNTTTETGAVYVESIQEFVARKEAEIDGIFAPLSPTFDDVTFSGATGGAGNLAWNGGDKTLDLTLENGVTLQIGQERLYYVKAAEAVADGEVVYASGAVGASGVIEVSKYIANNTIDEIYTMGVATQALTSGGFGYIADFGKVRGIQTDGANYGESWIDGEILYASPSTAGYLTKTKPTAPNQAVIVAMVIVSHATNGTLFVRPSRGWHLDELHDVYAPAPSDGQLLTWVAANNRYETKTLNLAVEDQVARDLALTSYIKADIAANDPAGVYGDIMSDNFTSDTLATKTNATYDATIDGYLNLSESNAASASLPSDGGGNTGRTVRQVISAAALAGTGSKIAISFKAHSSSGMTIGPVYVGEAAASGDAYDFAGTPTQLTFGGSSSVAIGAGATTQSDFVDFAFDETKNLVVSYYLSAGDFQYSSTVGSNWNAYDKAGDDAATVDATGYTARASQAYAVTSVDLQSVTNMTLQPSAVALPTANPLDISSYFRVENVDAVIDGTDRIISASIDGGTTWAVATITEVGQYGSVDKLLRADADVSAQTGSSFVWKLETANNKEQRIKQVASIAGY